MSDEEHQFESKADAGASKTYPQQAGTIRKNGYIVIKNRPCKVSFSLPLIFSEFTVVFQQTPSGFVLNFPDLDGYLIYIRHTCFTCMFHVRIYAVRAIGF
ncbi:hypothetical protein U1Q18_018286 [Sarracenia purpurea var. burkii]